MVKLQYEVMLEAQFAGDAMQADSVGTLVIELRDLLAKWAVKPDMRVSEVRLKFYHAKEEK